MSYGATVSVLEVVANTDFTSTKEKLLYNVRGNWTGTEPIVGARWINEKVSFFDLVSCLNYFFPYAAFGLHFKR